MTEPILLITPPFTQLNTPYPASAYIKGYLNTLNVDAVQADLGIDVILELFSKDGLTRLFSSLPEGEFSVSGNAARIYHMHDTYINTIDPVIAFLQNKDDTLAYLISERHYLPEANRFQQLDDLEWAFGSMGMRDKARHLATLYLEDISDFIIEIVDPHFGFSRYAERLGLSATSFDPLYTESKKENSLITEMCLEKLAGLVATYKPRVVCLSVPFPGNLFSALKCGQWLKAHHPSIKVVMGGGYPNTELRSVSDVRVFEYVDYITLDDGETPLRNLLDHLAGKRELEMLKRTFTLLDGQVAYCNGSLEGDVKQDVVGTPDYSGLPLKDYLSVLQLTNPMHRLWSDGRWNKLTMAHGCYWGKCTFCDISLDYIKNYEASSASTIVDRMETLVAQTGERGFHFVDEAAPPALMKAVALELLKRQLVVTWWTNIRFEKSFHYDLCRLLAASGCVAVSGGLEVASDRLLKLIDKGVTIEQVTKVNDNFRNAGIMVHAYLMYGFPTQTAQETIDSLEVVRQMFQAGVMHSGFWHRFAMTAHSPVGLAPEKYKVKAMTDVGAFANNDVAHQDPEGCDHDLFSDGLKKSLYNYMHGVGMDFPLSEWFDSEVPGTTHPADMIARYLSKGNRRELKPSDRVVWIGGAISERKDEDDGMNLLLIYNKSASVQIGFPAKLCGWVVETLEGLAPAQEVMTYIDFRRGYEARGFSDFDLFWYSSEMEALKETGLLVI